MVLLKRIHVENYKLFSQKELDFSNALLSVFDGPNGYGKTSIFDVIELLITGKISRILDCESIDGKLAYQTVFFAQNCEKDVILKAEFEELETGRYFVLGAKVKSADINGKTANPKNVFDKIEYFYRPDQNLPNGSWIDYIQNSDEIKLIRQKEFGYQNIEKFTLFHYIRQEDRLSYFKQSESSRAGAIESLLGVTRETEKYKEVQNKRKSIDNILKQISSELDKKKERLIEVGEDSKYTTEYEPLIGGELVWDKEIVFFGDSNKDKLLAQYLTELERIEVYAKFADLHSRYYSYEAYMNIPEKVRNATIHALVVMRNSPFTIDAIDVSFQNLRFLIQQKERIISQDYRSLDLSKIYTVLEVPENTDLVSGIERLSEMYRNQGELEKALINVIQMRENLCQSHAKLSEDAICPYCGYNWKTKKELDKQFASTKNILEHLLTQEGELYDKAHKNFKVQIEEDILVGINHKIAELSKMDILEVYEIFESKEKFAIALENAGSLFDISSSQLEKKGIKLKDDNEYLERMLNECKSIWNMIPSEYLSANEKYKFSEIRKKYLMNSEIISQLKKEQFDRKRQYLQEQFYRSFDKIKEEIHDLEIKKTTIEEIQSQLKEFEKAVKKAVEAYKKCSIVK